MSCKYKAVLFKKVKGAARRLTPAEGGVQGQSASGPGNCVGSSQAWAQGPLSGEGLTGWASGQMHFLRPGVGWTWASHQLSLRDAKRLMCQKGLLRDLHGMYSTDLTLPYPSHVCSFLLQSRCCERAHGFHYPSVFTIWTGDCLSSPFPAAGFIRTWGNK